MLSTLKWGPGTRTYILSVVALVMALALQGSAQGLITLAPMLKMGLSLGLTLVVPLIPVYIRKAITDIGQPKSEVRIQGA